LLLETAQ
jgi:hypothetical protein